MVPIASEGSARGRVGVGIVSYGARGGDVGGRLFVDGCGGHSGAEAGAVGRDKEAGGGRETKRHEAKICRTLRDFGAEKSRSVSRGIHRLPFLIYVDSM